MSDKLAKIFFAEDRAASGWIEGARRDGFVLPVKLQDRSHDELADLARRQLVILRSPTHELHVMTSEALANRALRHYDYKLFILGRTLADHDGQRNTDGLAARIANALKPDQRFLVFSGATTEAISRLAPEAYGRGLDRDQLGTFPSRCYLSLGPLCDYEATRGEFRKSFDMRAGHGC